MTTIAWDGETLAADSRTTAGNVLISDDRLKLYSPASFEKWLVNGYEVAVIGLAGNTGTELMLYDLLKSGITPLTEYPSHMDFTALCITKNGCAFILNKDEKEAHAMLCEQKGPYAVGSGGGYARAAMLCGKTAEEAVEIAMQLDLSTGGLVNTFTLRCPR